MKTKRIISTILAVVMLLGAFVIVTGAEESEVKLTNYTTNAKPTLHDYFKGTYYIEGEDPEKPVLKTIETPADKLAKMDLRLEKDGYRLYVDAYSGEVATHCIATGETLFSNPYNIGTQQIADTTKDAVLSQLIVTYTDVTSGQQNSMNSFSEAAKRGQIIVKNIKNGIRVEYTIGRENARMLIPRLMEREDFETEILNVIKEAVGENSFEYKRVMYAFTLQDQDAKTGSALDKMKKDYPITNKMDVYSYNTSTTKVNEIQVEELIKTYCPEFSYEDLDAAHMKTEYISDETDPPLFKMALEYTLDAYGMSVRLPANGIRFNETLYRLDSIDILPYMGAGCNPNDGYTFFPDGSGALFDFAKLADENGEQKYSGKYYGVDYAYHEITEKNQETLRYPVFGLVENQELLVGTELLPPGFVFSPSVDAEEEEEGAEGEGDAGTSDGTDNTTGDSAGTEGGESSGTENEGPDAGEAGDDETGDGKDDKEDEEASDEEETYIRSRGFLAIVEEGDALMNITTYHGGNVSEYNTVMISVFPRPKDSYNIADSISIGEKDSKWTVVSSRKYTGSYKIRYIMLTDDAVAEASGLESYYECSYMGMAKAYREYLERNNVLTRLEDSDVGNGIPLYIEVFGTMMTTKRILSIPVETMTPLTTFEDVATMYGDLSEAEIENINFILTGFTDGGLSNASVPYKLNWDNSVEKEMKFEELLADSKENGYNVFPDFDFAFTKGDGWFDGLSLDKHATRTIDGRYASKREYSATKQSYVSYFELALSPAYFSRFYEKLVDEYLEYSPNSIAVSTLGMYLNSDFDEDEPFNRADSKNFTEKAFDYFDSKFDNVLTSGGNAYSWKYVDHIKDIALDSSRVREASASVPFLGIVLHGYVQFAGEPINMEGNIEYAKLKALENGAALNFILSYRDTENLKKDEYLSKYYSIKYDFWLDDVVSIYNELNALLGDLQTSVIVEHKFLNDNAMRVPDSDEIEADAKNAVSEAVANFKAYEKATIEEERIALLEARRNIINTSKELTVSQDADERNSVANVLKKLEGVINSLNTTHITNIENRANALANIKVSLENAIAYLAPSDAPVAGSYSATYAAIKADLAGNDAALTALDNFDKSYKKLVEVWLGTSTLTADEVTALNAEYETNKAELIKAARAIDADAEAAVSAWFDAILKNKNEFTLYTSDKATIEANYEKAIEDALNYLVNTFYNEAAKAIDKVETLAARYEKGIADIQMFKDKDIYTAEARADLEAMLADVADEYALVKPISDELYKAVKDGYDALVAVLPDGTEVVEFKLGDYVEVEGEDEEDADAEDDEAEAEEETSSKYVVAENKIVYEVYSNGTAFILNFNNYSVLVKIDGKNYYVDAYGYKMLTNVNI